MQICYGWCRKPMVLSSSQRYYPEHLVSRLGSAGDAKQGQPMVWMPVWILMDGHYIRLRNRDEVELACKLVCVYHNGGTDAPFCDDPEWEDISEKEAFLAGMSEGETESEGEFV